MYAVTYYMSVKVTYVIQSVLKRMPKPILSELSYASRILLNHNFNKDVAKA